MEQELTESRVEASQPYEPTSFAEMLGTETVERSDGWAKVRMPIKPRHLQGAGVVQGGIIMTLADQAISSAVGSQNRGFQSVTVEMKVNFIAPAREGELIAEGRITHTGSTLAVGDATVTDGKGALIAKGLGTWMMLRPRR